VSWAAGTPPFRTVDVNRQLIEEYMRRPRAVPAAGHTLDGLTDRELEVLALVARGLSNAEIAQHLYVSPATAKTHVAGC
jgi:ATP/maltotriose-dependent transcriptional regulator MalT